ncbi:MAG TPA: DUF4339 domain-containing protein [Granulicella sp.]
MTYKIARDGQEFGPYSLADVQRYVSTGNILLTDLALAEGSTEWIPVSQVMGSIPVTPVAPSPYVAAGIPQFPDPPNLHWALVLVLSIVTCGLFSVIWDLVQVLWLKKVQPDTKALNWMYIYLGLWVLNMLFSFGRVGLAASHQMNSNAFLAMSGVSGLVSLATLAIMIVYRFSMRSSLEQHFNTVDPVGLQLGPIMTFFFGGLYFQYHLNRINEIKQAYRYGQQQMR